MNIVSIVEGEGEVAALPLLLRSLRRAASCLGDKRISVVLANREFEAWFIAAAASLNGDRGFSYDQRDQTEAEIPRDAKGWVRQRMAGGAYGEATDQPALTARMNLTEAFERSRSFRKLCTEWERQVS